MENVLSFGEGEDKLDMELGKVNFIVGPNNSGKTNVMRGIDHFKKCLLGGVSYADHVNIMRDGNEHRPFKIEVVMELDKEMKKIELFFEMLKEFIKEKFRKDATNIGENFFGSPIKDLFNNGDSYENRHEKIFIFCEHILNGIFRHLLTTIFSERTISISLKFDGLPKNSPVLKILTSERKIIIQDSVLKPTGKDGQGSREISRYIITNSFLKDSFLNFLETDDIDIDPESFIDRISQKQKDSLSLYMQIGNVSSPLKDVIRSKFDEAFPYNNPNDFFNIQNTIFPYIANKITVTDILRKFSGINSLNEYLNYRDNPQITTSNIPSVLFDMKNSMYRDERNKYLKIQKAFGHKTKHHVDIVSDIKYNMHKEINNAQSTEDSPNKYIQLEKSRRLTLLHGIIEGADGVIELISTDKNGREFGFENCGAGFFEILYFYTMVYSPQLSSVRFLDEPAQNLHPRWQTEILKSLMKDEDIKNEQFIITTHSPYLLPLELQNDVNLYYLNKIEDITKISKIIIEDRDIRNCFQRKKEIFFSDMNILVEGPSDVIYIQHLLESIEEFDTIDLEIVQCGGGGNVKKAHDHLRKWGVPSVAVFDADDRALEEDSIIKLPCDIEGTIVLGDFLWELKRILKKNYNLKKDYQKLYLTKKKGRDLFQAIDKFKEFFTMIKSSDELIEKLPTIIKLTKKLTNSLEDEEAELFRRYKITKKKLDEFDKLRKKESGKTELAYLIVQENADKFYHPIHPLFIHRIKSVLETENEMIESKSECGGELANG